jgi:DNA-binding IclR family transcriptional regulator
MERFIVPAGADSRRGTVMTPAVGVSARLLRVLDAFTIPHPVWTAEALSEALGYAIPTCYRYLRDLAEAGFVQRTAGGRYSLGYRIIALDHIVRHSDPLLQVAVPVIRDLASRVRCDVMLFTLYGNQVWTTHQEIGGAHPVGGADVRGRKLPLFRGAGSKVILANLPSGKLRALYHANAAEASAAGVGDTWQAFRESMIAIRKQGFHIANSEIKPQTSALAVPICSPDRSEVRALQLVSNNDQFALIDKAALTLLAIQAAGQINFELAHPRQ